MEISRCDICENKKVCKFVECAEQLKQITEEVPWVMDVTKIDIKSLPEFFGFEVFDAETGKKINYGSDIDTTCSLDDEVALVINAMVVIKHRIENYNDSTCIAIPKRGKYIIELSNGQLFRY